MIRRSLLVACLSVGMALAMTQGASGQAAGEVTPAADASSPAPQQPERVPAEADLVKLRAQLDRLLTETGLPVGDERDTIARQIEALAQQSQTLAKQTTNPRARLLASDLELRSNNALAQDAYRRKSFDQAAQHQRQMRDLAAQTKAIPEPAAQTVGDFWLLQADLLELNLQGPQNADERQRQAIALLEGFDAARQQAGDAVEHDDAARRIATDVRLSLLRLYDDRGDSARACDLVNRLRVQAEATDDAELREHLARWYGYCPTLGQRFEANLPTHDGQVWRSGDALGQPVLLHLWASWWPASWESLDSLKARYPHLRQRGIQVVSIDLGPRNPPAAAKTTMQAAASGPNFDGIDWPRCHQPPGEVDLQALFHVRSLPRYILLDAQGRVQAVGGSLAILEQVLETGAAPDAPVTSPGPSPSPSHADPGAMLSP